MKFEPCVQNIMKSPAILPSVTRLIATGGIFVFRDGSPLCESLRLKTL